MLGGNGGGKTISPQETAMPMIPPGAQLPLNKGTKSWSSTGGAAALELVDPLGSGLGCHSRRPLFFFFFFTDDQVLQHAPTLDPPFFPSPSFCVPAGAFLSP
eukprot:FR741665.1.p3 GENE.FR741665.1~~FR741665.1.p3  ORF type:complete len:102 (-),score=28.80 FR741665.1:620-925(-)